MTQSASALQPATNGVLLSLASLIASAPNEFEAAGSIASMYNENFPTDRAKKVRRTKEAQFLQQIVMSDSRLNPIAELAGKDLGLTKQQTEAVFGTANSWPKPFYDKFTSARSPRGRANAAASRLEHFVETNGTDKKPRGRRPSSSAAAESPIVQSAVEVY